jgi:hypothetical protein
LKITTTCWIGVVGAATVVARPIAGGGRAASPTPIETTARTLASESFAERTEMTSPPLLRLAPTYEGSLQRRNPRSSDLRLAMPALGRTGDREIDNSVLKPDRWRLDRTTMAA